MIAIIHPMPALTNTYIWATAADDSPSVCVVDPGGAESVIEDSGAVKSRLVRDPGDAVEVVTTIRGWKDGF